MAYVVNALAPSGIREVMHQLGGRTFSYFVIGNAVLILIPAYAVQSRIHAVVAVVLYLTATIGATLLWRQISLRFKR